MNKQGMMNICLRTTKGDYSAYTEWLMYVHSPNPRIQALAHECMVKAEIMKRGSETPSIVKQFMKEYRT